jgi:hypothetical protein
MTGTRPGRFARSASIRASSSPSKGLSFAAYVFIWRAPRFASLMPALLEGLAPTKFGVPNGIRTRVLALKGPRPGPLDDGDGRARVRGSVDDRNA